MCASTEPLPISSDHAAQGVWGTERLPLVLVFVSSLSVLAFELTLLRILSIRFAYHYASLVISISMLGLVLGGLHAALRTRATRRRQLTPWVLGLGLSYPVTFSLSALLPLDYYRILWEPAQIGYLLLVMLLFAVPFFIYGGFLARSLSAFLPVAGRVYASDLVGAAAGLVAALAILNGSRPEWAVVASSLTPIGVCVLMERRNLLGGGVLLAALLLCALILWGPFGVTLSPYKGLSQALQEEGSRSIVTLHTSHSRLDAFENLRMKFAPGLSLAYAKPIPTGIGIALDGEIRGVLIDEGALASYDFFSYMPAALPYMLTEVREVLVVDNAARLDALMPHYFGARRVIKAERDPSVVRFLEHYYPAESLYRRDLFHSSGRALLKRMDATPDLVVLSLTGFYPSGSFGLQEEYDFTLDAFVVYLEALKPGGLLFLQMFVLPPPRYEIRTMRTLVDALARLGVRSPESHLLVFRSWDTINFLVKKGGFSEPDRSTIDGFLKSRQYQILFPVTREHETFIAGTGLQRLLEDVTAERTAASVADAYPFDVSITTDDRPFFHYFLKLGALKKIYEMAGRKWVYFLYEGMALPFVLAFLVLISAVLIGVVLRFSSSRIGPAGAGYFLSIGAGFMFIEVFFIHRFILPYTTAPFAFAVVVGTLLVSSGAGSLLSGRAPGRRLPKVMAALPALIAAYALAAQWITSSSAPFLFLVAAGLLLGFFFPCGLSIFCEGNPASVPLAYALNGCASIIAPPLASVIAVHAGCRSLLIVAVVLYVAALFFLRLAHHRHEGNAA